MRDFENTFETRKQSFISVFSLQDCAFNQKFPSVSLYLSPGLYIFPQSRGFVPVRFALQLRYPDKMPTENL